MWKKIIPKRRRPHSFDSWQEWSDHIDFHAKQAGKRANFYIACMFGCAIGMLMLMSSVEHGVFTGLVVAILTFASMRFARAAGYWIGLAGTLGTREKSRKVRGYGQARTRKLKMMEQYDSVRYFNRMYAIDEGKSLREFPDMIRTIVNYGTLIPTVAVYVFFVYALINQRPLG